MNTDKYTPGPWQIHDDYTPEGRVTVIADVDGEYFPDSPSPKMTFQTIAVCEDAYGERLENADANARLIAAAPEMAKALERLPQYLAERAAWLKYEADNGGDHVALGIQERECRYLIEVLTNGRYRDDGRPSWLVNRIAVPASAPRPNHEQEG
jgi:hypothetical protein